MTEADTFRVKHLIVQGHGFFTEWRRFLVEGQGLSLHIDELKAWMVEANGVLDEHVPHHRHDSVSPFESAGTRMACIRRTMAALEALLNEGRVGEMPVGWESLLQRIETLVDLLERRFAP
jgi:hypothetical protein